MTDDFTPLDDLSGPGETHSNVAELARLFPDAVVDGTVDLDVLRDLLGEDAAPAGTEGFGLRWPGMAAARRLSTLPATMTLLPKPKESVDWQGTQNIVIEGNNLEVLRLLRRGYTNSVDVIYIDPPYNTGNDFVYDDNRVATQAEHETEAGLRDDQGTLQAGNGSDRADERKTGASRHSKWLSMMYPRLLIAHHLLRETGVLVVAIDDKEHARLKLLLDRVFGAENFIANVVWQGVKKNDSRYVSDSHDYMLIYAKNEAFLKNLETRWRVRKAEVDNVLAKAADFWEQGNRNPDRSTALLRAWYRKQRQSLTAAITNYNQIDENGQVFYAGDLASPNPRANLRYDLLHPITGLPTRRHDNGWRYSQETMNQRISEGRILFGADHTTLPYYKRFLSEQSEEVALSVFEQPRRSASQALERLLESDVFQFPKDVGVLARWIGIVTQFKRDAVVLDFFAGSGSTGHAVMELNSNDDGKRRYLLVQLDEAVNQGGYATIADITRERLRRAGRQVRQQRDAAGNQIDTGFRSYRLETSNVKPWDGSSELDLVATVDNVVNGRTSGDLLVETMLRLGIDLVTPVSTREVAGNTLYCLAGTLYAYFGTGVTLEMADQVTKVIVALRDEALVDSDITVVVRDTGFSDSSAKLNFAAALQQAGIETLRSI